MTSPAPADGSSPEPSRPSPERRGRPAKETELYPPLKAWLELQGYTVRGEVRHCDIAAVKDGRVIVVEMKLRASLSLLAQAAGRQECADAVYIALPAGTAGQSPAGPGLRRLLARLGIGLLAVVFRKNSVRVEVLAHPGSPEVKHRAGRRRAIIREVRGRDLDLTPGGLPGGGGRVSAYRQRAVRLAVWISILGEASPARLRQLGAPADTGSILSQNLYGWFVRVRRGIYTLHPAGLEALKDVPELVERCAGELAPQPPSA